MLLLCKRRAESRESRAKIWRATSGGKLEIVFKILILGINFEILEYSLEYLNIG